MRRYPPYREIADPIERRLAVVRPYPERWNIKSITGHQATTRQHVYAMWSHWFAEGLPGLEDQSCAPQHPASRVDSRTLASIRRLQATPELGGFRVSAALEQQGLFLSPRTCRRILAWHGDLGAATCPTVERREPRPHPPPGLPARVAKLVRGPAGNVLRALGLLKIPLTLDDADPEAPGRPDTGDGRR